MVTRGLRHGLQIQASCESQHACLAPSLWTTCPIRPWQPRWPSNARGHDYCSKQAQGAKMATMHPHLVLQRL